MRSHGVTNYPEPIAPGSVPLGGGNRFLGNGPNPNSSPTYRAASAACRKYAVASRVTPGGAARVAAEQLEYAQCIRTHGEPDFPDPSASGGFLIPKSVDENSPSFRAAENACKSLQPGFAGPPGISGS